MESLKTQDLTIDVEAIDDPKTLRLVWNGRSADRYPGRVLGPSSRA